jgi:hypothetical protein
MPTRISGVPCDFNTVLLLTELLVGVFDKINQKNAAHEKECGVALCK